MARAAVVMAVLAGCAAAPPNVLYVCRAGLAGFIGLFTRTIYFPPNDLFGPLVMARQVSRERRSASG